MNLEQQDALSISDPDITVRVPQDEQPLEEPKTGMENIAFPSPYEPPGTKERQALVEFYRGAYDTDDERERELAAVLSASHAIPAGSPIDPNRLNAADYSDEELKFFTDNNLLIQFPETAQDAGSRLAFMAKNDLTYLLTGDKAQGLAAQQFVPLGVQKEYEETLDTESLSPFMKGFEYTRSAITGGGPYALKDLDENLRRVKLNQTARTRILRQAARGDFTADKLQAALEEGFQFFGEAPTAYLPQATKFLLVDGIAEGAEWLFDEDYTSGKIATEKFFDTYTMEWMSTSDRIAEKNSTDQYKLRTDVVREITRPQGLTERTGVFLASDAAFAGTQMLYHGGRSLVSDLRFQSYMKKTYNTDTYQKALEEAASRGIDFETITNNYLSGVTKDKARAKLAERLDTSFAFRVMLPGAQRQKAFGPQMDLIKKDIRDTEIELEYAREAGNLGGIRKAELRIEKLNKDAQAIKSKVLLPKYYRDMFGEVTEQAIVSSYMAETAYKIFGTDSSAEPIAEFFGAVSTAIPKLRSVTTYPNRATANALRFIAGLTPGVDLKDAYKSASPETKLFLKTVFKQPDSGMAQAMVAGSEEAIRIRRELMQLAEQTGVDIDYDYFSNTIVELVSIEEFKSISQQLDGKLITIENLGDLGDTFSRKIENNNKLKEMVTKLSEATYKLTEIRASGEMTNLKSLDRFVAGMNTYISDLQRAVTDDEKFINDLLTLQEETQTLLIKGGVQRSDKVRSDGTQSLRALDSSYDTREQAIIDRYEGDIDAGVADPDAAMENLRVEIDAAMDKRTELLMKSADELTSAQSALGQSSQHFASAIVQTKRRNIVNARRNYRSLDRKYKGARTNVTEFYEKFKNVTDFVDGDIPDYSAGAVRLRGMDPKSATKTGAKILFNDGAKRGLADLREQVGDDVYTSLIEHAELGGMQPIQQWEGLKAFLKNPGDKAEQVGEYLDAADASELSDGMLMLLSPGEWRAVDSHMGSVLFQKRQEGVSVTYANLKEEWNTVSDPNSPMAFQSGYDTGVPENVTEEFYADFKEANRYYEKNVADRIYVDDDLRRWNRSISRRVMSKRDGDIPEVVAKSKRGDQPITWLDQILKPVQNLKDRPPMVGEELYQQVGQRLAKSGGGVWDEGLQKYVFVQGEGSTEAMKSILTAHMRGRLIRTKAGRQIIDQWDPTTARKPGEKDPLMLEEELNFNDAEFESMFDLPVYTRDQNGNLVESGKLLNDEEVYSAIDLDALERNRADLKGMFEEAEIIVRRNKEDALEELASMGITSTQDIGFARDLAGVFNIDVGEAGLSVSNMNKVAEGVFNTINTRTAEGFAGQLARIKNGLRQNAREAGISANNVDAVVDDFLKRMTIQHIYSNATAAAGNVLTNSGNGGPVIKMAMGMDGDAIRMMIGKTDLSGETEKNLRAILGGDVYNHLETVADTIVRLQAKAAKGVGVKTTGMSLESILSRVYNINRQVVSTQWVATETLIRALKQNQGALFHTIMSSEQVAKEVFEIIETGQVPEYKEMPRWLRTLTREVARFESINETLRPEASIPEQAQPPQPPITDVQRQMMSLGYEPR